MPNKDLTHVMFIIDRSGSMNSIAHTVQKQMRDLAQKLSEQPGELRISTAFFNDRYSLTARARKHEDVSFAFDASGMTALYDAIVQGVMDERSIQEVLDEDDKPVYTQIVVVTDGEENSSHNADAMLVSDTVQFHTLNLGWDFTFLGANQDAVYAGEALGFEGKKSMTFSATAGGVEGVASSLSDYISQGRRGEDAGYTESHRSRSI